MLAYEDGTRVLMYIESAWRTFKYRGYYKWEWCVLRWGDKFKWLHSPILRIDFTVLHINAKSHAWPEEWTRYMDMSTFRPQSY